MGDLDPIDREFGFHEFKKMKFINFTEFEKKIPTEFYFEIQYFNLD